MSMMECGHCRRAMDARAMCNCEGCGSMVCEDCGMSGEDCPGDHDYMP